MLRSAERAQLSEETSHALGDVLFACYRLLASTRDAEALPNEQTESEADRPSDPAAEAAT
jgi:hypothetical protein